jgi:hypothetical protein
MDIPFWNGIPIETRVIIRRLHFFNETLDELSGGTGLPKLELIPSWPQLAYIPLIRLKKLFLRLFGRGGFVTMVSAGVPAS